MSTDGFRIRQVLAVVVGNGLEYYDFVTFAFFASQIGRTSFPSNTPGVSPLASLATFGVGFLTRPVGHLLSDVLATAPAASPPCFCVGWRVALLFGAAIIPVGLVLRRTLHETLDGPVLAEEEPAASGCGKTNSLAPAWYMFCGVVMGIIVLFQLPANGVPSYGMAARFDWS